MRYRDGQMIEGINGKIKKLRLNQLSTFRRKLAESDGTLRKCEKNYMPQTFSCAQPEIGDIH